MKQLLEATMRKQAWKFVLSQQIIKHHKTREDFGCLRA
jgi:hypothetical protein